MGAAQRFLVLVHGVLALGLLGYTLLVVRIYIRDMDNGYISEGATVGVVLGLITASCLLLVIAGLGLWARTGKRRFLMAADLVVGALSWTALIGFILATGLLYIGFLGVTMLATLVAVVVPPPVRRATASDGS
jgi:hypothetical protein